MVPLATLLREVIDPTLLHLQAIGIGKPTQSARALLLAIQMQEDRAQLRVQRLAGGGAGPARGLWQFERGGGVAGVMRHAASKVAAREICRAHDVRFDGRDVWEALPRDDRLACAFARLLLWTDPRPLPAAAPAGRQSAWEYYLRNWRPGKPHPDHWPANWAGALAAIGEIG